VAPGDAIRFEVSTGEPGYLAIVGADSAREVTAYFPAGAEAQAIGRGPKQLLDGSIILDETLGPERITAVLCKDPLTVARLIDATKQALERAGGDPLKLGEPELPCHKASFVIEKRAR
jgi:hypothetical protein